MASCEMQFTEEDNKITTLKQEFKPITNIDWYKPLPLTSWQAQIYANININYNASMYIVDLFNTRVKFIKTMKSFNKKVICYFSAGVLNVSDEDSDNFSKFIMGNSIDNYPIKWLDVSSDRIIHIMQSRLNLAKDKGCDGVLPSDLNEYAYNNGFNITKEQQIIYAKYIANSAHNKHLGVGLLGLYGVNELYSELEPYFDFAIGVDCHLNNTCNDLSVFSDKNKAIFDVEFGDKYVRDKNIRDNMCIDTIKMNISTIVLPIELDDEFRYSCE